MTSSYQTRSRPIGRGGRRRRLDRGRRAAIGIVIIEQRELAEHATLDAVYVSKLVQALVRSGHVSRTPDPTDRRAVRVELTDLGRATADQAIPLVRALLDELTEPLGGLDATGTRRFARELQALLAATPSVSPSATPA